jgi:hypothetical protein
MPMTGFPGAVQRRIVMRVTTALRAIRVLLILMLAALVISFIMALGTSSTGLLEKVVLLILIGGCVYAAARITTLTEWMVQCLRH